MRGGKAGLGGRKKYPLLSVAIGKEPYQGCLQVPWDSCEILPLILVNKRVLTEK